MHTLYNTLLIIANSIAIQTSHTLTGDVPIQHSDPCTQEEFLFIASVLDDKVELSDLATSLKVPLDNVDDNDTKRNQIVKILLYWQSMNCSDSSKANLLKSLQTLNNYSDVEEVLKPYLGL